MESITKYLQSFLNAFDLSQYSELLIQVGVVILVTLVISFLAGRVLAKLEQKLAKTENKWDDAFIHAFKKPLKLIINVVGIFYAAEIIYLETKAPIFAELDSLRDVIVIAMMAWALNRFISKAQENIHEHAEKKGEPVDQTTSDAIVNILKITVVVTSALVALQTLGISISGILAFGGVGGVAVGFAAKDLLANFFGAMVVYLDKPFGIGDWIRSPDREIEGVVEKIGWRQTMIRTFDKRPLYVPNSVFANIAVENPSRMKNRRIYENIGVRYADMKTVKKIVDEIRSMLEKHKEIDARQTLIVNLLEFNSSSVDIMVYTFTKTTDWVKFHGIKEEVLLTIADIIEANGAEMAFPSTSLYVESLPGEVIAAKPKTTKKKSKK